MNNKLDSFIDDILNSGDDEVDIKECHSYKSLVRDLEVLELLKSKLIIDENLNLTFKDNTLSANEFNKIKGWLK